MGSSEKVPELGEAPRADEFEVSVFGPGIGECIVVHLGHGDWIVVDSCLDLETREPVALKYLDAIGVSPDAVLALVVTHWHDDHIAGMCKLFESCPNAKLVFSSALRREEYKELVASALTGRDPNSGVGEFSGLVSKCIKREGGRKAAGGPDWALADKCLMRTISKAEVHSLSPSNAALTLALRGLEQWVPRRGAEKRRAISLDPNEIAVVLWIQACGCTALLGADLECSTDQRLGWTAVVQSAQRPLGRANLFKVPHHGSSTADSQEVWDKMLNDDPVAVVAPFTSSGLPKADDVRRLLGRTELLYATARGRGRRPQLPRAARKLAESVADELDNVEHPFGVVRVRGRRGTLIVHTYGDAHRIQKKERRRS